MLIITWKILYDENDSQRLLHPLSRLLCLQIVFNIYRNAFIYRRGGIFSARTIGHDLGSKASTKIIKTSLYGIGRKIFRPYGKC